MAAKNPVEKSVLHIATHALVDFGPQLANNKAMRRRIVRQVDEKLLDGLLQARSAPGAIPGIDDDRTLLGEAIVHSVERGFENNRLCRATREAIAKLLVQGLFLEQGDLSAAERFRETYGMRAPTFLVLSPGKLCNLHCVGCYADSTNENDVLDWDIVDRMIQEAKTLWGARFFVISGGEPFAYRSQGKGVLDLVEKHKDCFFLAYTNSTLITDAVSARLANCGNLMPAISVEGWKERTDARRGEGVYDKILATMQRLRRDGVPFGISLTATRYNYTEILSDEFIDFFIAQGALFGWIFQYMPIGRSFTLELMPTPEQRLWMWHRSWEIIRGKQWFLADFWNQGTTCDGCLSAGGHGAGGYFYVDWNGAVTPCVFVPYSPVNIKEVYAQGGTLNDVWNNPFFRSMRSWQVAYKDSRANGLAPCPNRDHHADFERILAEHEPDPIDMNAMAAMQDAAYSQGLRDYDEAFQKLSAQIWEEHYLHPSGSQGRQVDPLPDIDPILARAKEMEVTELVLSAD
jgi:MoaA/NifB/PqqE/SkfB family radical SAM enzyme